MTNAHVNDGCGAGQYGCFFKLCRCSAITNPAGDHSGPIRRRRSVSRLNAAALGAMQTSSVRDRLQGLGAQIVSDDRATPQSLAGFLKSETVKWAAPIKANGISVE